MPRVSVQLTLHVEGLERVVEDFEANVGNSPEPSGAKHFAVETLSLVRAELLYGEFYQSLPDPTDLFPHSNARSYTMTDNFNGKIETEENKRELWRYVGNVALAAKVFLSKAQALNEIHRTTNDERRRFILLLEKLDKLNSAVHAIANMRDFHIRIVSEGLGGIDFAVTRKDGKKHKTRNLDEILKHRHEIQEIQSLDDRQLKALEEVAEKLKTGTTANIKTFLAYRNRLVHDSPQSVDDPNLFPQLQSRETTPMMQNGVLIGHSKGMFTRQVKPDWSFEEIFSVVVNAFEHYLGTLRTLRSLERFGS